MRNSPSSLNTLYTAESTQFISLFLPTTISLTPRFRQKREVWLENTQNDPKTHSDKYNNKFSSAISVTTLSYASCFRWYLGVIENFEYVGEFEEDIRKCWLYWVAIY